MRLNIRVNSMREAVSVAEPSTERYLADALSRKGLSIPLTGSAVVITTAPAPRFHGTSYNPHENQKDVSTVAQEGEFTRR
jgi:hypothetical protein